MFHQFRGRKSWRKEVKLEAAKVMKPRSELNPGVWQGDWRSTLFRCGAQPPSAIALTRRDADCSVWVGIAEFERCCLTRRRGDSGDRTASQRGSRWGGRLTNAARGGYRNAVLVQRSEGVSGSRDALKRRIVGPGDG